MDETRDIELAEQAVELEAQAPWPLIEASGLGLATSRGVLFEGIDASVPKGAVCAVLGPYGIKRSALILTLCSRCRFTSGKLRVGKYSMEPS
ncbi:MAG: hypothetical protein IJJ14_04940, partial [Coriobacteriales bacterium]|nr:hypothetical protein [Coriobacteriales bacterium]